MEKRAACANAVTITADSGCEFAVSLGECGCGRGAREMGPGKGGAEEAAWASPSSWNPTYTGGGEDCWARSVTSCCWEPEPHGPLLWVWIQIVPFSDCAVLSRLLNLGFLLLQNAVFNGICGRSLKSMWKMQIVKKCKDFKKVFLHPNKCVLYFHFPVDFLKYSNTSKKFCDLLQVNCPELCMVYSITCDYS